MMFVYECVHMNVCVFMQIWLCVWGMSIGKYITHIPTHLAKRMVRHQAVWDDNDVNTEENGVLQFEFQLPF